MTDNRIAGDHSPHATTPGKPPARRKAAGEPGRAPDKVTRPAPGGQQRIVRVGSPASLLALVPQLMGFEPRLSIVLIGIQPPRGQVRLTLRFDLPPDAQGADEIARRLLTIMAAQGIRAGLAVGYGPGRLVTPVADALREHSRRAGFLLTEVLRACGGRYWSYVCARPSCCPADGVPYDVASHEVTAAFAAADAPPVLASREDLAQSIAQLDGAAGESMREATRLAEERAGRLIEQVNASGREGAARRLIAAAGLDAVSGAITRYREGGELSDADAAWLCVVLKDTRVRDDAWSRMDPPHRDAHRRLWTDLTRRARPGYVAPAASLLAFVAWQDGNGALANVALDRALADSPRYSMAGLLRTAIDGGAPPQMARCPMTPEQVAASYAEEYGEPGQDRHGAPQPGDGGRGADDAPQFGDAAFGDPGYDDCDVADTGDGDDFSAGDG
jgi:hypothetical protein